MRALIFIALFISMHALAVIDGYKYSFENTQTQKRFNDLSQQLRCPKCQNQSLADSNSPVAKDLRDKLYELLSQGKNDDEIVGYMVDRYGDFVRYNPPFSIKTLFLWGAPVLFFIVGVLLLVAFKPKQKKLPELSEEELIELKKLKQQAGVDKP